MIKKPFSVSLVILILAFSACLESGLKVRLSILHAEEAYPSNSSDRFSEKSAGKAILLSAIVPGLGQIYIGERRDLAIGIAMVATDAFAIWRYAYNKNEGNNWKKDYQSWARAHYKSSRYWKYVRDTVVVYSGYEDFGRCKDPSIYDSTECWKAIQKAFYLGIDGSETYYDQIGRDPIYIFGWDDWNPYTVPNHEDAWTNWQPGQSLPVNLPQTTEYRNHYNHLRDMADRSYGRANVYAWVMVIGRVVSMIDAAMMIRVRSFDIGLFEVSPRLAFGKRSGNHGFNLTFQLRF